MEIQRDVVVRGPAERVFAYVDDLGVYPQWMDLVHDVDEVPPGVEPMSWDVELQANVGPFARSKRLRMIRVEHERFSRVRFERRETDGRDHSPWVLSVDLSDATDDADPAGSTDAVRLTMTLRYGGNLWAGAVLQRVLDDHVERGANALSALLADTGDEGDIT